MIPRRLPLLLAALLFGCTLPPERMLPEELEPLPPVTARAPGAARTNGRLGTVDAVPPAIVLPGTLPTAAAPEGGPAGDISLAFADSDLRDVVEQVLSTILGVNYTIDPAVHGTVTLKTSRPLNRSQVLAALQAVLAQNGATLAQVDGLYRVAPAGGPQAGAAAASVVVPLRYASAEELAKVLQPFVGQGGRIAADPGRNALIVASDADTREILVGMIRGFDSDLLAGQSYALFPVVAGGVKDFASGLQEAFRSQNNGALASLVRVVPMERVNAVMVVSSQPRYVEEARRIYSLVDRARRQTIRSWHITYLQNSDSSDVAYVLQSALTPNNVTAQPRSNQNGQSSPGRGITGLGASGGGSGLSGLGAAGGTAAGNNGGISGAPVGAGGGIAGGGIGGNAGGFATPGGIAGGGATATTVTTNPLLGGLDVSGSAAGGGTPSDGLRIVPNDQNNALLIFATMQEQDAIEAILRKIDIIPRQVRIDATIAEVTLNDQLQYGTQFFFRSGGINGALSTASARIINPTQIALNSAFPGFFLGGSGAGGAPFAISALQSVTTVNVLSSPQLLVLDNQPARLQVGNLVPYLAQTSQSTAGAGAPVINSINYQQTGVIMQVRPRVNSGGLVTLDIAQEVSDVNPDTQVNGINSPTFLERNVTSRVVVQDGQTIGLAGLIRDTSSRGNEGIPWLKDIPLLGLLAGKQNNTRARTELLILITPHVVQDQRDARALTEDLREQLINAAMVPQLLRNTRPSGLSDPGEPLRRKLRLQQ